MIDQMANATDGDHVIVSGFEVDYIPEREALLVSGKVEFCLGQYVHGADEVKAMQLNIAKYFQELLGVNIIPINSDLT